MYIAGIHGRFIIVVNMDKFLKKGRKRKAQDSENDENAHADTQSKVCSIEPSLTSNSPGASRDLHVFLSPTNSKNKNSSQTKSSSPGGLHFRALIFFSFSK